MESKGFAVPAIVVGLAVVSTAMLVSTLVVFQATPPTPTTNCLEPTNGSSREVTLFPQGEKISLVSNGLPNSSLPLDFCLDRSVDLTGAWNSNQPVSPFALFTWQLPMYTGCDPQYCFHRNGTFDGTLFPGAYAVGFFVDTWANVTVNVTQPIELVFDRVTEMLQPSGPVYLQPGAFSDWQMSVPSGARNVGFDASEVQVNVGFYAGLMNASEFAEFEQNPSALDFQNLSWEERSTSGCWGSILSSGSSEFQWTPGNYTLVFWNYGAGSGTLQFDDPLYVAFNVA